MISYSPVKVLFSVFGVDIYSWGVVVAIALLVCSFLAARNGRRKGLDENYIYGMIFYGFIGGLIFGRLLYVVLYLESFNLVDVFRIWQGGLISYGGLFGGFLFSYVYCKLKRIDFLKYFDVLVIYVALGFAISRVGCFLNWCCYGVYSSLPWAVNVDFPRHPTQIYHSFSNLLIFGFLNKLGNFKLRRGVMFFMFWLLYSFFRFFVDFFRDYGRVRFLSLSQYACLVIFVFSLVLLLKKSFLRVN